MRLTIVNLTGGGLSGGYRTYLQNVVPRLVNDRRVSDLHLLVPPDSKLSFRDFSRVESWPRGLPSVSRWVKHRLGVISPDVVFVPTARWLDCGGAPVVSMVRNMEALSRPFAGNSWPDRALNVARACVAWRACRRADRVIAVSQFVRDFLVRTWRLDPSRIGMVYHGVSKGDAMPTAPAVQMPQDVPMLFAAGSIRPARGLEDAILAVHHLHVKGRPVVLAIAGSADHYSRAYQRDLIKLSQQLNVKSNVIWLGELDRSEMAWCFERSAAFVMTSRVEACPNVALEAMTHGCSCIAVTAPPMPEMFGQTARYYTAGDSECLSRMISTVIDTAKPTKAAIEAASRRRAAEFSWERTVEGTIAELQHAMTRNDG